MNSPLAPRPYPSGERADPQAPAADSSGSGRPFVPLCMTADELAAWRAANRAVTPQRRAARPCSDCPRWFANEMRQQGMCNGAMRAHVTQTDPRRLQQWREATARQRAKIRIRRTTSQVDALASEVRDAVARGGAIPAVAQRLGIDDTYARDLLRREVAA